MFTHTFYDKKKKHFYSTQFFDPGKLVGEKDGKVVDLSIRGERW